MSRKFKFNTNQLSLPLPDVSAAALSLEHRQRVFWFLASVSLLSLIVYIYAINATAHNIAARQNLEKQVAQVAGDLGALEFQHIELRNSITLDTAHEYGFQEVSKPLYITRGQDAGVLTLNTLR